MRAVVALSFLGLLLSAPASAEDTLKAVDLEAQVSRAEKAFGKGDMAAVSATCDGLSAQVTLLGEPLSPAQAARVHTLMAVCGYVKQKARPEVTEEDIKNVVTPYIRAARAADPRAGLAESADTGEASPLARYFATASRDPAPGASLPDIGWGRILVDGREVSNIPSDTPAIVQRACGAGTFGPSRYLQAGSPPPDWEHCPMKPGTARHIGLGVGTGVAAAATMGFVLVAANTQSTILRGTETPERMEQAYKMNHLAAWAQGGGALATVGLGTALVLTW